MTKGAAQSGHKSLESSVVDWLNKSGFPLEMRAAKVIRSAGPDVYGQSQYYTDPKTNELREVDIMASWASVIGDEHKWIHLVVEYKGPDGVWILFRHRDEDYVANGRHIMFLRSAPSNFAQPDSGPIATAYTQSPVPALLQGEHNPCYGITQKGDGRGKDHAYEATRQAASGAFGVLQNVTKTNDILRAQYCLPLVVTTCRLFVAELDENNDIKVTETDRDSVIVPTHETDDHSAEVHIVHESALPQFMADFVELAQGILTPGNLTAI
ncbi:hypothetical protein [Amycolatopsis regifaucium]|uniref:hypothetical protein n=1 Tax=Amycolatopsis regifaucium TaxID=546365 RepID=UPI0008F618C0|nr:hypothetical protein [Amycolatopsis regifaucium]SFH33268.1 hypothetical protein SAMN04489731_103561 [Amycolatopsis regifaucium]